MLAACAAALGALGTGVDSASAVIVHLSGGRTLSYQPLRGAVTLATLNEAPADEVFTNLDYGGGPIMPSNTNYAIYWDPSGAPAYPAEYTSGVNQFFEDLAHDSGGHQNVESVSSQYNDAAGEFAKYESQFGGAFTDEDPYPANGCKQATICLTDAQLQTELKKFVKAHSLPTDLAHEYFLITPSGVEDCFEASGAECSVGTKKPTYCAYHSNIALGGGSELIYANDPFVTGNGLCETGVDPSKKPSEGLLQGGLSHEHNESITDPEPNNAWTDWGANTGEIGDKCRTFTESTEFGKPLGTIEGQKYNQVINGHDYWYQQEWSNQGHKCLQRLSFSGEEPIASFLNIPRAGDEVELDASESTAPGGVRFYVWQFNEFGGPEETVETTSPTLTHTFFTGGSYTVALTVMSSNGTSIGAAHSVEAGALAPTAAFTSVPSSPNAGQSAVFNGGESKAPSGTITAYKWRFGDGTNGTGVTPSHTYSIAGTYEVTLAVTDSAGNSQEITHNVTVNPVAPTATTGSHSVPTTTSVTLEGTVDPGGAPLSKCQFEYGPEPSYGSTAPCAVTPPPGNNPVAVTAAVKGLVADTKYHYRLVAANSVERSDGLDAELKTPIAPKPAVSTEAATGTGQNTATLNATVNPEGGTLSDCHFEYGTTEAYGSEAPCSPKPSPGAGATAVAAAVASLIPGTEYHYRVVATNENGEALGEDKSLKTLPLVPPEVATEAASAITQTSATLNASLDARGASVLECRFEYGTSTAYGASAPCPSLSGLSFEHVTIEGLAAGATYHYRLVVVTTAGNGFGGDQSLSTLLPTKLTPQGPPEETPKPKAVPDAELLGTNFTANVRGLLTLRVSCPAGESRCTGSITLRTLSAVSTHSGRHRSKAAILTLGSASFTLAGGKILTVHLHLSAAARSILAHSHRLRARAIVLAHDPAGASHSATSTLTIRQKRPARRR